MALQLSLNEENNLHLIGTETFTCNEPPPNDVYVTYPGNGKPLTEVEPNTTYALYVSSTATPGTSACFKDMTGFTAGVACFDLLSYGYESAGSITTNSSIGSGISMTFVSLCYDGTKGTTTSTFFIPAAY
ncbi:MAG: hypothetical protein ACNS60_05165 [Candidatus Cyclobacteriaceae bacterium M2_1C_046]